MASRKTEAGSAAQFSFALQATWLFGLVRASLKPVLVEKLMTAIETQELRRFFGLDPTAQECRLYLPIFSGPASLVTGLTSSVRTSTPHPGPALLYPGHTFADRDARAASYISSVLSHAVKLDGIQWEEAGAFAPDRSGTMFLFGSRSNQATEWATRDSALGKFFRFEFGRAWSIRSSSKLAFSLPAPDALSSEEYEKQTDFGVVGRYRNPTVRSSVFVIAGLGGRATEGCAYYLAHHWKDLARRFTSKDFAIVLKFPPPIDPKNSEEVIAFDDDHAEGVTPKA